MEETIHIRFIEKKNDLNQKVADLEEEMENMSLNGKSQNQQNLQIATSNDDDNVSKLPCHQHVSDDISEEPEGTPLKRTYIGIRDLKAVSQNQIIGKPS